ncbi:hypothetical protein FR483_n360L [Paramecium bursaria Chlorella virus FR483]|uniref:Uncharacterized protein n360L n=1 Tax=Paramecium bursaria Chlorella virus FR483 TaxID=399781 RepID=A7J764_PBCVF|nr:hypothetical protein FR483_n360L [Paramecium bursaria Chlorella virus FR483]ABT15645.1 hypothetical protein FR483_n360L [Paramecium bursaria Chlorella virus FR483]
MYQSLLFANSTRTLTSRVLQVQQVASLPSVWTYWNCNQRGVHPSAPPRTWVSLLVLAVSTTLPPPLRAVTVSRTIPPTTASSAHSLGMSMLKSLLVWPRRAKMTDLVQRAGSKTRGETPPA